MGGGTTCVPETDAEIAQFYGFSRTAVTEDVRRGFLKWLSGRKKSSSFFPNIEQCHALHVYFDLRKQGFTVALADKIAQESFVAACRGEMKVDVELGPGKHIHICFNEVMQSTANPP